MCRLTKVTDGIGINVKGHLDGALEIGAGDPAVVKPEALNLTRLDRELPKHLHGSRVYHFGEVDGSARDWKHK